MDNSNIEDVTLRRRKFRITVKMKKPLILIDDWFEKPNVERVIEAFKDALMEGKIDDYFEITIEEAKEQLREETEETERWGRAMRSETV